MQERLWIGVVAAVLLAAVAGVAEHRRTRRRNIDRVSMVPWPTVQFLSLIAAVILGGLALGFF